MNILIFSFNSLSFIKLYNSVITKYRDTKIQTSGYGIIKNELVKMPRFMVDIQYRYSTYLLYYI